MVFYSERGKRTQTQHFETQAQARRWAVDHLYDSVRTSLNHRWWHAHPQEWPASMGAIP